MHIRRKKSNVLVMFVKSPPGVNILMTKRISQYFLLSSSSFFFPLQLLELASALTFSACDSSSELSSDLAGVVLMWIAEQAVKVSLDINCYSVRKVMCCMQRLVNLQLVAEWSFCWLE